MDYSLCNALGRNTHDPVKGESIPRALIIYDVSCQYCKKFQSRLDNSPLLQALYSGHIPILDWGVGKFHLGAHIATCYGKHSINHKVGGAQNGGETAEELWSRLNPIFTTARSKTLPHRQENMDTGFLDVAWRNTNKISE